MAPKPTIKPSSYKALEQWHRSIGSNQYYIDWLQERAAKEGAPLDAIFYSSPESKWITVRDLAADHPFRRSWEK